MAPANLPVPIGQVDLPRTKNAEDFN